MKKRNSEHYRSQKWHSAHERQRQRPSDWLDGLVAAARKGVRRYYY